MIEIGKTTDLKIEKDSVFTLFELGSLLGSSLTSYFLRG